MRIIHLRYCLLLKMGCCFFTEKDVDETAKSQMSLGSRNWFYKSIEQNLRFYILADCVRAKRRSLANSMVHDYNGENFQADVKLRCLQMETLKLS